MLERLLFSGILIAVGIAAWVALNRLSLRSMKDRAPADPILVGLQLGIPTVVYFTTPSCEPCRTFQRPTLNRLQAELGTGAVQIVQVDATEQPEAADRWSVFSAPTTFILDGAHQPQQVNRGVASLETLKRQIAEVSRSTRHDALENRKTA